MRFDCIHCRKATTKPQSVKGAFLRMLTISLKRFQQELTDEELSFYIRPLRKNAPFLSDLPGEAVPDFSKGSVVRVDSVQVVPQYVTTL